MSGIAIRFRDKILSDSNLIRILIKDSNERVTLFLWIRAVRIIIIDSTLETFLSIDRGVVKRWSTVSKSSVSSSWQEFRRFRVRVATARRVTNYERGRRLSPITCASHCHWNSPILQFPASPPRLKWRGGEMFRISIIALRYVESKIFTESFELIR